MNKYIVLFFGDSDIFDAVDDIAARQYVRNNYAETDQVELFKLGHQVEV